VRIVGEVALIHAVIRRLYPTFMLCAPVT
jgi:hypothetical protein